ncbi:MAG: HAD family hydrolase [Deltaproteobacteria bacterium]|nr:HAD family hydrolase [Deltaproteobacteria bacterium]
MTKTILFDFGQTLVNSADGFRAAEKKAKQNIYADFGAGKPPWDLFLMEYRKIRKAFHQDSNFSRPAIWQAVYETFRLKPDPDQLQDWETRYWEQVKTLTIPFPETIQTLEQLVGQCPLALITNTQGQETAGTHRIALFPQLEKFFDVVVVAGEGGIPTKPDPEPFRQCLKAMGVPAEEAVYVGDDWRIDICGARNVGIQPVWIQHHSVKRNWPEVEPFEPTITHLDQLLTLPFILSGAQERSNP